MDNKTFTITNIHIIAIVPASTDELEQINSQIPSKREREQEAKVSRKVQKILGATSVSGTRIFETISKKSGTGLGEKLVLPYSIPNFTNFRTRAGMIFADKTMYIEHLEKNRPDYRYRQRRFGKSAFLNMLCDYYDIHKANIFDDLFGPLFVGKNPTSWCNKHLVLKFELSSISVSGSRERMETSFNEVINCTLLKFLKKYEKSWGIQKSMAYSIPAMPLYL